MKILILTFIISCITVHGVFAQERDQISDLWIVNIDNFSFNRDENNILIESNICTLWNISVDAVVREWDIGHIDIYNLSDGIQFLDEGKIFVRRYLLDIASGKVEPFNFIGNVSSNIPNDALLNDNKSRLYVGDEALETWKMLRS